LGKKYFCAPTSKTSEFEVKISADARKKQNSDHLLLLLLFFPANIADPLLVKSRHVRAALNRTSPVQAPSNFAKYSQNTISRSYSEPKAQPGNPIKMLLQHYHTLPVIQFYRILARERTIFVKILNIFEFFVSW